MTPQAQQETKAAPAGSRRGWEPARSGPVQSRLPHAGPQDRTPDPGRSSGGAAWLLLLLPVLCCGAPLLLAVAATLGALAWGALGGAVALLAGAGLVLAWRRARRCRPPATESAYPSAARHAPGEPVSR